MKLLVVGFSILLSLSSITSHAERLDLTTQSALIEKLESLLNITTDNTTSKQNMILRLADLHSERARLLAMDQEGRGEEIHRKEISQDRSRALDLYNLGYTKAEKSQKGAILFQMAHLNQMLGREKTSRNLFDQIIKEKNQHDKKLVGQAYIEVGDFEMNKGNFKKALENFQSALKIPESLRRGYAKYRIAWCRYNLGETTQAIGNMTALLKDKNSFQKADGSFDVAFQEEASRDLATFLAQKKVTAREVQLLSDLSPENVRQDNLTYFATELDRTGHKEDALQVWALVGKQKESFGDKLENQIKIARIQYDLNKKEQTVKEIDLASKMLKEASCKDQARCDSLQLQIRGIVTDWGKAEEREPSQELILAYKTYVNYFPDIEINYWAAIAANKRKQYSDAVQFFKNSAVLSYELRGEKSNLRGINISKIFEGSLLGAIESAELSKSLELRKQAYGQYLKMNPNGSKSLEVQYQIAHATLESGDRKKAAELFHDIALTSQKGSFDIKNKAADLALDTLVLLKDDDRLEEWSQEFAEHFPNRKKEFYSIQRKTILNRAANIINTTNSESDLKAQWNKLSKTNLSKASAQERIQFHKNKSIIALKLKNISAIQMASQALLSERTLSKSDRREALHNLVWTYEMQLDFKNALKIQKQISSPKDRDADDLLKLGILSELAKQNAIPFYEQFLVKSSNKFKNQQVAFSLVRLAKNKNKTFQKYNDILRGNSQLYISAGLFAYDEKRSDSLRKNLLSQKRALGTFEGQLLNRSLLIEDVQTQARTLAQNKLKSSSQSLLKKTIQERLKLINQFEKTTKQALAKEDWTLQVLTLSVISREYSRLASDISHLPTPRGLTKAQQLQYKTLIREQIKPYVDKSQEARTALLTLWDKRETSNFTDVENLSIQSQAPGAKLAKSEVGLINNLAKTLKLEPVNLNKKWQLRQKLSLELDSLKTTVSKNPFDFNYLSKMRDLENELGRGPMVAYLDSRITSLQAGGRN